MSYVVLARKWRPQHFEEVVGQGHVARTLKNSIMQDRVAHAYLFTGARGVGKTSTARILAKALNCHKGPTATPCYECPSCTEISAGQSVDVFEIDGASNRGINEIRELREGARYAPSRDRYKIYIIDEVHMLTTEAFNALLKTLEEPPGHVKFVFATTEPQKIPVTILSRCQRFDFKRITQQDIVEHLTDLCQKEGIQAEKAALQLLARQAAGGMRDALSLLDQVISFAGNQITEEQVIQILGVANRRHLFELSHAILSRDAERALVTLDDVHRYGYDLHQFASELVNHMRDLMVARVVQNPDRVTNLTESELEQVKQLIQHTTPDLIHRLFSVFVHGAQEMSRSPYPKLIFEMTLVRMCQLEPLVGLDLMVEKLTQLEQLIDDETGADDGAKKKIEPLTIPRPSFSAPAYTPPHAPTPQPPAAPAPVTPSTPVAQPAPQAPTPPPTQAAPAPAQAPVEQSAAITPPTSPAPEPLQDTPTPAPSEPVAQTAPAPVEEDEAIDEPDEDFDAPDVPAWLLEDTIGQPAATSGFSDVIDPDYDPDDDPTPLTIGRPMAPKIELDQMTALDAWRLVVDHLRYTSAPTAATLEHAYVETFNERLLSLAFTSQFYHFVQDNRRMQALLEILKEIFGDELKLDLQLLEQAPKQGEGSPLLTLAQIRDAQNQARYDKLYHATEHHPLVLQAQELFGEIKVRVSVEVADR